VKLMIKTMSTKWPVEADRLDIDGVFLIELDQGDARPNQMNAPMAAAPATAGRMGPRNAPAASMISSMPGTNSMKATPCRGHRSQTGGAVHQQAAAGAGLRCGRTYAEQQHRWRSGAWVTVRVRRWRRRCGSRASSSAPCSHKVRKLKTCRRGRCTQRNRAEQNGARTLDVAARIAFTASAMRSADMSRMNVREGVS